MNTAKTERKRRTRITSLGFVAMLLVGSAAVRVGTHSEHLLAFAENMENTEILPTEPAFPRISNQQEIDSEIKRLADFARDLQQRNERVAKREFEVDQKIAIMNRAEEHLTHQLKLLEKAEENLRATIALADTAAEEDLKTLTSVYENMKPKEAAGLFEEMTPEFAAGFLVRMRTDAAAAILAGLEPSSAYSISVVMAGRNAEVPTSDEKN